MANDKPLASGSYTIVDITDQVSLYSYIKCNVTTNQFLSNKNEYSPDYSITNPILEAEIYKVNEKDNLIGEEKVISSKWLYKVGNGEWTEININTNGFELIGTSPKFTSLKIKSNFMNSENPSLIIRNLTEYQEIWMQTSVVQLTDLDFSLSVQGSAGLDAYTVVVDNENQSLSCLPDGTIIDGEIGPNGRAKTKIEVFKGTTKLTAVNENPGKGQFACSLNNLTGATTFAKESDNCTFYLDGVNSDLGKAVIDVYLESTTLKTQKTFSFNKSKDGEGGADAYSIDIVGPNQFIYDANDNYAPEKITLNVIGQNFTPSKDNIQWQYKNGSSWANLLKGLSIDITPSTAGWSDKELRLRAVYLGNVSIYDEFTVYKVQDGKHTVSFYLTTPKGNTIRNEDKKSLLIEAKLYYGEINKSNTNEVTYTWFKQNTDMSWAEFKTTSDGSLGGNNLEVFADDILVTANFKCVASYEGKTYEDVTTLNDFSDPYVTNISNVGGTAFKNGIGKTHLSCDVNRGTEVLDIVQLVTNTPEVNSYNNGDIIYVIADDKYREKVNGAWSILTNAPSEDNKKSNFTYKWRKTNKDGTTSPTLVSNGKVCKVLSSEIDETATYSVELELNGSVISFSQITITNTNDGQDGSDGSDGTDGKDSYSVQLTNESHIIACDYKGIPKLDEIGAPTSKARSSIIAKRGDALLSPISTLEALSKDKYKYEILPNDTCEVARIDDESFYVKNVYADSGYVDIKVYAESTDNVFTKKFTWSKLIDAENAKYVVLSGDNTFKYDDKSDSTPTPVNLKITAEVFNIDSYTLKWQYKNANDTVYKDITSDVGSLISGNTLTINDTKLFDAGVKNIVIKCIAIDSSDSKQYFSTFSVFKVYDGSNGSDGSDSKTVKITGINQIKYTGDTPNYTSITLTATPTNYTSPTYVWSKLNGSTFEDISDNGSLKENELMLDVSGLSDTNLFRVKCSESNGKDVSFDEFQVVKVYDGTDANEYLLRIVNGTRSLVYNGKNNLITTQIVPFEIEVYKNGTNITDTNLINNILWECNGYFTPPTVVGQITFRPVPLPRYDMEDMTKLNTNVLVTVNVEGRILKDYVAIAVSKNSTALDWVDDWDGNQVQIGDNYFISPKIFAGKKDTQTNNITGLALGRDIVQDSPLIGMAIYYENNVIGKILSTPDSDGNILLFGNQPGKQLKLNKNGLLSVEGGVLFSSTTVSGTIDAINKKPNIFSEQPKPPYYEKDLWVQGSSGDMYICVNSRTIGIFVKSDWELASKYTDNKLAQEAIDKVMKTIESVDNWYYLSTSSTSITGGSWTTTAPIPIDGKYIWSKIISTLTDGTKIESNPVCLTGAKGATGVGIKSIDEQYYVSNSATVLDGGSWLTTTPTWENGKYIWTRTLITYTDNTTFTSNEICTSGYHGKDGINGSDGSDGISIKTVDVEYAQNTSSSTAPTDGWTTTAPTWSNGKYIWSRTKTVLSDGTTKYTNPACITGQQGQNGTNGVGVSSIVEYYKVHTSNTGVTNATSGFTTTVPTMTETNKYLWNYELITYTNGITEKTTARVIGMFSKDGTNGSDGKGISSIVNYYLASASGSGITTSTSGWTTTIQTVSTSKKYLWNYEVINYTTGSPTTTSPAIIGVYGDTGATGTGITSITEEYRLSTDKTTAPTSGWETTPPTWSVGKYMWTRSKIVYSNPTSTVYTTPICDSSWEAVNEIEIGTRNFIRNSALKKGSEHFGTYLINGEVNTSKKTPNGNNTVYFDLEGNTDQSWGGINQYVQGLEIGKQYTASCNVFLPTEHGMDDGMSLEIQAINSDGEPLECFNEYIGMTEVNEWKTVKQTFILPLGTYEIKYTVFVYKNGKAYVGDFSVVEGNKAIWSTAPEDLDDIQQSIDDMSNDGILTPSEKIAVSDLLSTIHKEKASIDEKIDSLGMSTDFDEAYTQYVNAYASIVDYLTPFTNDMSSNSSITRDVYNTKVANYNTAYNMLAIAINNFYIQQLSDTFGGMLSDVSEDNKEFVKNALTNALIDYIEKGEFNQLQTLVNTQMKQTSDSFEYIFNKVDVELSGNIDDVNASVTEIQKYITFDNGDIVLSNNQSEFSVRITNSEIGFMQGGTKIAYISNSKLFISQAEITDQLAMGNYLWLVSQNGDVNLIYNESL